MEVSHPSCKPRRTRRLVEKPVLTELPETGMFRIQQFIPSLISVGRSTWWKGVKAGTYPQPVRKKPGGTFWRAEDLREFASDRSSLPPRVIKRRVSSSS